MDLKATEVEEVPGAILWHSCNREYNEGEGKEGGYCAELHYAESSQKKLLSVN